VVGAILRTPRPAARRPGRDEDDLPKLAKLDRRFADPAWHGNPVLRRLVMSYLAWADAVSDLLTGTPLDWQTRQRATLLLDNLIAAAAPTNVPLVNPAPAKQAWDTGAEACCAACACSSTTCSGRRGCRPSSTHPRPAGREMVGGLLSAEGVVVQPPLEQAGRDDWLVFSMPELGVTTGTPPEPRPTAKWFDHLAGLRLDSEREVEIHFVSPLFEQLGYAEEQEAAGFGFVMWEGVRQHLAEADLLYFAGDVHDIDKGDPQVLVECKDGGERAQYRSWPGPQLCLLAQAGLLRGDRRRLPHGMELPGRRRPGRTDMRGQARNAARKVR
jgi:hypothetical protein